MKLGNLVKLDNLVNLIKLVSLVKPGNSSEPSEPGEKSEWWMLLEAASNYTLPCSFTSSDACYQKELLSEPIKTTTMMSICWRAPRSSIVYLVTPVQLVI